MIGRKPLVVRDFDRVDEPHQVSRNPTTPRRTRVHCR
jgi:hypothetical protein